MSWSPSPYDDGMINDYQANSRYANMTAAERSRALQSQLPSSNAAQGGRGLSVKKKSKKSSRKSARHRPTSSQVDVKPMPDSDSPYPSTAMDADSVEEMDMAQLKGLAVPMGRKRQIRKTILENNSDGLNSGWQGKSGQRWKKFKENLTEALRVCQLWRSAIHEIEGHFGNGIRSYFSFLRWLFMLNVYIFVLVFFFICVPTIIYLNSNPAATSGASAQCDYNPYNASVVQGFQQYIIWWFTGQGFMEKTLLFYGYYESSNGVSSFSYNLSLAYILIAFSYFFLSLALIVKRAGKGLKESLLSGENRFYSYCNKVFGGWDFCITNEKAATLKHRSIKYELESDLEEERIRQRQQSRTTKEKAILYTKRILINTLVFGMLAGSLAGIYFAADYALRNSSTYDNNFLLDLLVQYLVSIVITFANFVAPLLFGFLIQYEDYSPGFTIKFTLIRTVILRLVSVMFLYLVVYFQINCDSYSFISTTDSRNCGYCDGMACWETYLGQEMYKLTVLDFFIVIAVTLFVEFPRRLIATHCTCGLAKLIGLQEFDIPTNVLDIVYAQTILWIGAFYSPLLPAIVVIKFFIFFYMKKLTLMHNCKPAERPYRASRSGTFFFIILMFGFVVAAIPVGVSLAVIPPSQYCGPFRGLNTMFATVSNTVATFPSWLASIFFFLGSAGFSVIVGVILCLILYYYVALNNAHKKMIQLLKEQLTLEGKDKQFLLNRVNDLQSRMAGVKPDDVEYRSKRTSEVARKRNTVVFENEDIRSRRSSSSLPGQTK